MNAFRLDTKLIQDGTLTLNDLPFQAGDAVEVIIVPRASAAPTRQASPLQGKVLQYDNPTAPVAQEDWEALR